MIPIVNTLDKNLKVCNNKIFNTSVNGACTIHDLNDGRLYTLTDRYLASVLPSDSKYIFAALYCKRLELYRQDMSTITRTLEHYNKALGSDNIKAHEADEDTWLKEYDCDYSAYLPHDTIVFEYDRHYIPRVHQILTITDDYMVVLCYDDIIHVSMNTKQRICKLDDLHNVSERFIIYKKDIGYKIFDCTKVRPLYSIECNNIVAKHNLLLCITDYSIRVYTMADNVQYSDIAIPYLATHITVIDNYITVSHSNGIDLYDKDKVLSTLYIKNITTVDSNICITDKHLYHLTFIPICIVNRMYDVEFI